MERLSAEKIMYIIFYLMLQVSDWQELHHMANSLAGRIYQASFGQDYYTIGKFINQFPSF